MNTKHVIVAFLMVVLYLPNLQAQENEITQSQFDELDELVEDLVDEDKFSGAILVAKEDKILYQKAVGFSNKATNSKNTINTKFNLASMNKMFTGIAIAQLVEKQKLNFSDKVGMYLTNLPEKTFGSVTIQQLLTHSSGTGDFMRIPKFMEIKDSAKTITTYLELAMNEPLLFSPGTRFEYSNYGYILLGAVIEKITGLSYFEYVKTAIFSVAKMKNTDSFETDKITKNLAIGYALPPPMPGKVMEEKPNREPNTDFIEVKGTSAGGGYSTVIDLFKFSRALMTGKLLSQKGVDLVTTGKIVMEFPMPPNAKPMPMPQIKYGYGFGETFVNDVRIIGHNGGAPGVDSQLDIYPDLGYTVIVLCNYDMASRAITSFIQRILTKA